MIVVNVTRNVVGFLKHVLRRCDNRRQSIENGVFCDKFRLSRGVEEDGTFLTLLFFLWRAIMKTTGLLLLLLRQNADETVLFAFEYKYKKKDNFN